MNTDFILRFILVPAGTILLGYSIGRVLPSLIRGPFRNASFVGSIFIVYFLKFGISKWPWVGVPYSLLATFGLSCFWPFYREWSGKKDWSQRLFYSVIVAGFTLWPLWMGSSFSFRNKVILSLGTIFVGWFCWLLFDRGSQQMKSSGVAGVLSASALGFALLASKLGAGVVLPFFSALAATLAGLGILMSQPALQEKREVFDSAFLIWFNLILMLLILVGWRWDQWYLFTSPFIWVGFRDVVRWQPSHAFSDFLVSFAVTLLPMLWAVLSHSQKAAIQIP